MDFLKLLENSLHLKRYLFL